MPAKKRKNDTPSAIIRAMEAAERLTSYQVLKDFVDAGLIAPCCIKETTGRGRGHGRTTVFYSRGRVEWCVNEILEGRYPQKKST